LIAYIILVVDSTWHIIDTLSIYDMIRLLLGSKIEDSITSRVVIARIIKRTDDTGEHCGRPKLNALGSSFWLFKKITSFQLEVKESVQLIISFWNFCTVMMSIRVPKSDLLKALS
jgi:hypothetical protein